MSPNISGLPFDWPIRTWRGRDTMFSYLGKPSVPMYWGYGRWLSLPKIAGRREQFSHTWIGLRQQTAASVLIARKARDYGSPEREHNRDSRRSAWSIEQSLYECVTSSKLLFRALILNAPASLQELALHGVNRSIRDPVHYLANSPSANISRVL